MNQRFTEQQQRIATLIQTLTTQFPKYIDIALVRKHDNLQQRGGQQITNAAIDGYRQKVNIVLVEAENSKEFDEWAEALVKAEELLQQLENERLHELQTPDFFRYIILANSKFFRP